MYAVLKVFIFLRFLSNLIWSRVFSKYAFTAILPVGYELCPAEGHDKRISPPQLFREMEKVHEVNECKSDVPWSKPFTGCSESLVE
jgi:hypothetical protein